jgi:YidC/Oxa1 family membrane protein insertase
MFTTLIAQPIFNLLVAIYALLPGHNFGLAIIIFTIIIRLMLWPLVKKQLHQTKVMRKIQPELKKIKQQTKGDRQKEALMTMELYKERGINPFSTLPLIVPQFIILIGLYLGLQKVIHDPHSLVNFAYPALQHLPWMEHLAHNIHLFDNTLFGLVDLNKSAISAAGLYVPALIVVLASTAAQFFQSKQLNPTDKDARGLREIMRSAGQGKQSDQAEMNAALSRFTIYLLPAITLVVTIRLQAALSLYWLFGGLVAIVQQSIVLRGDETEMEAIGDKPTSKKVADIPEAEVVHTPKPAKNKKSKRANKRRKR